MKKSVVAISIVIVVIVIGMFSYSYNSDKFHDNKVIYPLSKVKDDEDSDWILKIAKAGTDEMIVVSDEILLHDNKKTFKVTFIDDVYMSTPGYFVEVFKNDKKVQSYPLLYLNQIDFGTIPKEFCN